MQALACTVRCAGKSEHRLAIYATRTSYYHIQPPHKQKYLPTNLPWYWLPDKTGLCMAGILGKNESLSNHILMKRTHGVSLH